MERAYHLGRPPRERVQRFGKVSLLVPELSGDELRHCLGRLREAAARIRRCDRSRRITAIAAAAARLLDPADPLRRTAEELLSGASGFSPEMIRESLPRVFGPIDERSLERELSSEPRAASPLVAIIAAGNIPGVGIAKMALALAAGSACAVKTGSGEPVLAPLFARALSDVDPALGEAVAALWWRGGDLRWEEEIVSGVDSLIAYGSDETLAALRSLRPKRFVGYGHRLSVALVRLDAHTALEPLAAAAALDVSMYDQLGCLSPQVLFTIGEDHALREAFTDALARSLADLARRIPRGDVPEAAVLGVRRLRDEYEWREIRGDRVHLRASRGDVLWTVIDDAELRFRGSPLYRTIFVRALANASELRGAVEEVLPHLECAGLAPWPDEDLERAVSACGLPHIAPLGRMQSPTLGWRQGGMSPMAGIIAT